MADYYTNEHKGIILGESVNKFTVGFEYNYNGKGFDLTKYKKLCIDGKTSSGTAKVGIISQSKTVVSLDSTDDDVTAQFDKSVTLNTTRQTYEIDISALSGGYFIVAVSPKGSLLHTYIYNIWLE